MAYTIRILMPKDMCTGIIFRTYEEAEKFLNKRNYTFFGNGVWVEQLRWIPEQTMSVVIEEIKYGADFGEGIEENETD